MSRKTEILQSIIDVWCRDQDIDAVLTHLSDDLVWHYSAISQPPKHGKAGAREFLEAYKAKVRNPHWRIFRIAETEDALFGIVEGVLEAGRGFEDPDFRRRAARTLWASVHGIVTMTLPNAALEDPVAEALEQASMMIGALIRDAAAQK